MSNKHRYLFLRLQELLSGFILGLIFCFIPRNNKRIILNSVTNNSFDHNSKYLYLHLKNSKEFQGFNILFVINDDEKRNELIKLYGDDFISNRGLNKIKILMASTWFCSALQTPVGGFFLSFRRIVVHIGHGMPYKNIVYLEKNLSGLKKISYFLNSTNFTFYLATSEFYMKVISSCFRCNENKILVAPQPRADAVVQAEYIDKFELSKLSVRPLKEKYNILYAPTWRHYADVTIFPFEDADLKEMNEYFIANDIVVWLRLHPFFDNSKLDISDCENIKLFSGKDAEDINLHLHYFDSLITDYSSIFLDYLLLERPVIYFDYDFDQYQDIIGLITDYKKLKSGPSIRSFEEFKNYFDGNNCDFDLKVSNRLANYVLPSAEYSKEFLRLLSEKTINESRS